jgi:hypothetical protein
MKKNIIKSFFAYLMWLLPAIILILSVANWYLNFLVAIWLITLFHFIAMYYIINSSRLKISEK